MYAYAVLVNWLIHNNAVVLCSVYRNHNPQSIAKRLSAKQASLAIDNWADDSVNSDSASEEDGKSAKKRPRTECPIRDCSAKCVHIPLHLRKNHGMSKKKAVLVSRMSKIKSVKKMKATMVKHKDYHSYRKCPIVGCSAVVQRMAQHLQGKMHGLQKDTAAYKTLLLKARKEARQIKLAIDMDSDSNESIQSSNVENNCNLEIINDIDVNNDNCDLEEIDDNVENVFDSEADSEADDDSSKHYKINDWNSFEDWMLSVDGGLSSDSSAKQNVQQVKTVLDVISEEADVKSLWNKSLLRHFLKTYSVEKKQHMPGTIKSYLASIKHFYSFCLADEHVSLAKNDKESVERMIDTVSRWIRAYKNQSSKRQLEKGDDDLNNIITPAQISVFEKSKASLMAVKLIGTASQAPLKTLTMSDFVLVRDYLISQIAIGNANRSGVIANMTVAEFLQAKLTNDQYIISVKNHKTSHVYGPAKVVVNNSLYSWIKVYFTRFRNHTVSITSDPGLLFVSWNGGELSSGQVSKCLQSVWGKAGLNQKINCTLIRKTAVSEIHEHAPELKGKLADSMCHRVSTADKSYRLADREKSCLAAARHLSTAMRATHDLKNSNSQPISVISKPTTINRLVWNEPLLTKVLALFDIDLKNNNVSFDIVKQKLTDNPDLADIDPRKVYDKLRKTLSENNERQAQHAELPTLQETVDERVNRLFCDNSDGDETSIVGPSIVSSKDIFQADDIAHLSSACSSIIMTGPISQPRIIEALNASGQHGKQILQKFKIDQIISRIKYERRKMRKKI
jgi:site-specific recombinase XerC